MPIGPVSPKDMGRAGRGTSSGGSYGKGVSKGKMTTAAKSYPTSNVKVVKPVKAVKVTKRVPAAKKAVDKAGAEGPKRTHNLRGTPKHEAARKKKIANANRINRLFDGREQTSYELRN